MSVRSRLLDTPLVSVVQSYLDALSRFCPSSENGGVSRLAFSVFETQAMNWAKNRLETFGYECKYDAFLNLHAYDQKQNDKRVLVGTHVDTVLDGGRYDGTVGLLSFLAALHLSKKNAFTLSLPVDFVIFRAEESTVFKVALLGSKVATGYYDLRDLANIEFDRTKQLKDLTRYYRGYLPEDADLMVKRATLLDILSEQSVEQRKIFKGCWLFDYPVERYHAYFETHIEQGRLLESKGVDLGLVVSFRAPVREIFTLKGRTAHSGATPMGLAYRQDALCAASESVLAIERICNEGSPPSDLDIVGTVGELSVRYAGINKVPGECTFTLDLRSGNLKQRELVHDRIHKAVAEICRRRNIDLKVERTEESKPVSLADPKSVELRGIVRRLIQSLGYSCMDMPSGAGHDAMRISERGIPVCMLFIPCKDGVSHSPNESARVEDIVKAAHVLAETFTGNFS